MNAVEQQQAESEAWAWLTANMPHEVDEAMHRFLIRNPQYRGAAWWDCLSILDNSDAHIDIIEPMVEKVKDDGGEWTMLHSFVTLTMIYSSQAFASDYTPEHRATVLLDTIVNRTMNPAGQCIHCGQELHSEGDVLVDTTGGDVCGSYGTFSNEPHVLGQTILVMVPHYAIPRDEAGRPNRQYFRDFRLALRWMPELAEELTHDAADQYLRGTMALTDLMNGNAVHHERLDAARRYLAHAALYYQNLDVEPYPGRNAEAAGNMNDLLGMLS